MTKSIEELEKGRISELEQKVKELEDDKLGYVERICEAITQNLLILRLVFVVIMLITGVAILREVPVPNWWRDIILTILGASVGTEGTRMTEG